MFHSVPPRQSSAQWSRAGNSNISQRIPLSFQKSSRRRARTSPAPIGTLQVVDQLLRTADPFSAVPWWPSRAAARGDHVFRHGQEPRRWPCRLCLIVDRLIHVHQVRTQAQRQGEVSMTVACSTSQPGKPSGNRTPRWRDRSIAAEARSTTMIRSPRLRDRASLPAKAASDSMFRFSRRMPSSTMRLNPCRTSSSRISAIWATSQVALREIVPGYVGPPPERGRERYPRLLGGATEIAEPVGHRYGQSVDRIVSVDRGMW